MAGKVRSSHSRLAERLLMTVGVACLGYYGFATLDARQFQRQQAAAIEAQLAARPSAAESREDVDRARDAETSSTRPSAPATREAPKEPDDAPRESPRPRASSAGRTGATGMPDGALGLLDVPRLKISAPVLSGDDEATLSRAVGHLPDTPRPWEPGNSALAAHRDGLFRPLRDVRIGDVLRLRTAHGELTYTVRETKIVTPDDLSVLAPSETPMLTLITCYPFNYVGAAPKRFIVHATLESAVPPAR